MHANEQIEHIFTYCAYIAEFVTYMSFDIYRKINELSQMKYFFSRKYFPQNFPNKSPVNHTYAKVMSFAMCDV